MRRRRVKSAKGKVQSGGICFLKKALPALLTFNFSLFTLYASSSLLDQANTAWAHRAEPGQTERAIALWKEALAEDPSQAPLYVILAKACGRAVRHSATTGEEKRWADEARHYGDLAVQTQPNSADAWAQQGEALAQWANARKGIHSLGAVKQAVAALEKAVQLNPQQAYAHMLLAEIYRQSPGKPISVGNKARGFQHAQLAVTYGSSYAINHIVLARAYLEQGRKEDARKELQAVLDLKAPPDAIPETAADKETAREMLKKL